MKMILTQITSLIINNMQYQVKKNDTLSKKKLRLSKLFPWIQVHSIAIDPDGAL